MAATAIIAAREAAGSRNLAFGGEPAPWRERLDGRATGR